MNRFVIRGVVYKLARTRQDDLWDKISEVCENIQTVASSDSEHNRKKEVARDHILSLKGLMQEVGLW